MVGKSDCEMVELFILVVLTINQLDQLSLQWQSRIIEKAKTNGLAMLSAKAHSIATTFVNIQIGAIFWKPVIKNNSQVHLKVSLPFVAKKKKWIQFFSVYLAW